MRAALCKRTVAILTAILILGGCGKEWLRETPEIPGAITEHYRRVVNGIEALTGRHWYYGWRGNFLLVFCLDQRRSRGECYQWAVYVYRELAELAKAHGFTAEKIGYHTAFTEHHAVLLFRTVGKAVTIGEFLDGRRRGYVFDAWTDGQARVYDLREWVRNPLIRRDSIRFEYHY